MKALKLLFCRRPTTNGCSSRREPHLQKRTFNFHVNETTKYIYPKQGAMIRPEPLVLRPLPPGTLEPQNNQVPRNNRLPTPRRQPAHRPPPNRPRLKASPRPTSPLSFPTLVSPSMNAWASAMNSVLCTPPCTMVHTVSAITRWPTWMSSMMTRRTATSSAKVGMTMEAG